MRRRLFRFLERFGRRTEKRGIDEDRCSFCSKNRRDVKTLAVGPEHLRICNECLEVCKSIIADRDRRMFPLPAESGKELPCSFCSNARNAAGLIAGPTVYICKECVEQYRLSQ